MSILKRRAIVLLGVVALILAGSSRTTTMQGSDWNAGDVFIGVGDAGSPSLLGTYRVVSETGSFKEDLVMLVRAVTSGCAIDRVAGDFWATSFDAHTVDTLRAVHGPGGHDPIGSIDVAALVPSRPGVAAIESIVFDRAGNFYVGVADEVVDINYRWNFLNYDGFGSVVKFSPAGAVLAVYRVPVATYPKHFRPRDTDTQPRGVNWIDLSSDGKTLFYTSQDRFIRTFQFDTNADRPGEQPGPGQGNALTIDGVPYANTPGIWAYVNEPDRLLHALRLLPPGDGSGGALVAGVSGIYRLNATGAQVMFTSAPDAYKFFAINISPDAKFVWTATQTKNPALFKFHVPTGKLVPLGSGDRLVMPAPVNGLCVKQEYTSQVVECAADSANPLCRRIELCSASSPGDDDGDGLTDIVDDDCIVPGATEICWNGREFDDDGNGLVDETCGRTNAEGDTVAFSLDARLPGETRTYAAANLPPGISIDALTGRFTGTLAYAAAGEYQVTVSVARNFGADGQSVANATFTWTVLDKNGPPTLTVPDQVAYEGTYVSFVVPQAVDPDGEVVTQGAPGPLPAGLTYDAATRTISGIPSDVAADTTTGVFITFWTSTYRTQTDFRWTILNVRDGARH